MTKDSDKFNSIRKLIENNTFSPVEYSCFTEDGDFETRIRYPKDFVHYLVLLEKVRNGESEPLIIKNKELYEALDATYPYEHFNSKVFSKYYIEVKNKMEEIINNFPDDDAYKEYVNENGFEFTLDFLDPFFIELARLYDEKQEKCLSNMYCFNTDSKYVMKNVLNWLSDKHQEDLRCLISLFPYTGICPTSLILSAFLYIGSKREELKGTLRTYVIEGEEGTYKIGRSRDPYERAKAIKCGNPKAKLLFDIDMDVENELHTIFKDKRINGEWFKLSEKDLKYIRNYKKKKSIKENEG